MRIERMTAENCSEVAALDKICFAVPWSEKSFCEEMSNPLAVYYIAAEEKIIGYCGFWKVCGEAQVTNIAVLPEYRKKGVASQLIERLLSDCADMESVVLEVRESNEAAIRLYEKFGFKKAGVRKNFYHTPQENGIVMVRDMNNQPILH